MNAIYRRMFLPAVITATVMIGIMYAGACKCEELTKDKIKLTRKVDSLTCIHQYEDSLELIWSIDPKLRREFLLNYKLSSHASIKRSW